MNLSLNTGPYKNNINKYSQNTSNTSFTAQNTTYYQSDNYYKKIGLSKLDIYNLRHPVLTKLAVLCIEGLTIGIGIIVGFFIKDKFFHK